MQNEKKEKNDHACRKQCLCASSAGGNDAEDDLDTIVTKDYSGTEG